VWEDSPDDHADAGALWSPNGKTIVWHHNITPGAFDRAASFGVGRASLGEDGKWTARVPRQTETFVTPVAWADDSRVLLCARIHESRRGASPATLLLKDAQLQPVKVLFGLPRWRRSPEPWCYGRPGDWGAVPADALLSPPDVPGFRRPGGAAPPKGRRRPLTP